MKNILKRIKKFFLNGKNKKIFLGVSIVGILLIIIFLLYQFVFKKYDDFKGIEVDGCIIQDFITDNGDILVSVLNNNFETVTVSYVVEFYDSDNELSDKRIGTIENIFSNSTGYGSTDVLEVKKFYDYKVSSIKISKTTSSKYKNGIEVLEDSEKNDVITITFKNTTSDYFDAVNYDVLFFDKKDNIIGYTNGEAYGLNADGTVSAISYVPFDKQMFKIKFDRYEIVNIKGVKY